MKRGARSPLDIQIGLELNRALVMKNGDAAIVALADFIRAHRVVVSDDAWRFLEYAVFSQRKRDAE